MKKAISSIVSKFERFMYEYTRNAFLVHYEGYRDKLSDKAMQIASSLVFSVDLKARNEEGVPVIHAMLREHPDIVRHFIFDSIRANNAGAILYVEQDLNEVMSIKDEQGVTLLERLIEKNILRRSVRNETDYALFPKSWFERAQLHWPYSSEVNGRQPLLLKVMIDKVEHEGGIRDRFGPDEVANICCKMAKKDKEKIKVLFDQLEQDMKQKIYTAINKQLESEDKEEKPISEIDLSDLNAVLEDMASKDNQLERMTKNRPVLEV